LALVLGAVYASPAHGESVWDYVQKHRADGSYSDSTLRTRVEIQDLFRELTAWAALGTIPEGATTRAHELGWALEEQDELLFIVPADEVARGLGWCVLRLGPEVPDLVLEAPHGWSDLHTGRITADLFEAGVGRAACFNGAHRHSSSQGDLRGGTADRTSDLAHRPDSAYQAATLGIVSALGDPLLVQVHGFGDQHRSFSAVVSAGASLQPASVVRHAMTLLDPLLSPHGLVADGTMVRELAGTTNVQGRATSTTSRFIHLELSLPVRQQLIASDDQLSQLGAALERLAESAP